MHQAHLVCLQMMRVFVKTLTGKTVVAMLETSAGVMELKECIEQSEDIPADEQRLIFAGLQLKDDAMLADFCIRDESTVHLVLKLTGD